MKTGLKTVLDGAATLSIKDQRGLINQFATDIALTLLKEAETNSTPVLTKKLTGIDATIELAGKKDKEINIKSVVNFVDSKAEPTNILLNFYDDTWIDVTDSEGFKKEVTRLIALYG